MIQFFWASHPFSYSMQFSLNKARMFECIYYRTGTVENRLRSRYVLFLLFLLNSFVFHPHPGLCSSNLPISLIPSLAEGLKCWRHSRGTTRRPMPAERSFITSVCLYTIVVSYGTFTGVHLIESAHKNICNGALQPIVTPCSRNSCAIISNVQCVCPWHLMLVLHV